MAVICHVESNIPQLFPEATTDRFQLAAMELLDGGPLSFETIETLGRVRQSVQARSAARPWATALTEALDEGGS